MAYSQPVECNNTDFDFEAVITESLKTYTEELDFEEIINNLLVESIETNRREEKNRHSKQSVFNHEDFEWHQIRGDGNCLPRAISEGLEIIGITVYFRKLRQDVIHYMRNHKRKFMCFFTSSREFNKYLDDIAKDGFFCDGTFISAICNIYNVKVNIFNQTTRSWTVVGQEGPDIFLSYENNNHYSLLTPK
jgi:hypothetical protein